MSFKKTMSIYAVVFLCSAAVVTFLLWKEQKRTRFRRERETRTILQMVDSVSMRILAAEGDLDYSNIYAAVYRWLQQHNSDTLQDPIVEKMLRNGEDSWGRSLAITVSHLDQGQRRIEIRSAGPNGRFEDHPSDDLHVLLKFTPQN